MKGSEEQEHEVDEALEFSLQISCLPRGTEACYYQIHRETATSQWYLVYESKFQNPNEDQLVFDEATISTS